MRKLAPQTVLAILISVGCIIYVAQSFRIGSAPGGPLGSQGGSTSGLDHSCKAGQQSPKSDYRQISEGTNQLSRRSAVNRFTAGLGVALATVGSTPRQATALFEDVVKSGGCPTYEQVKAPTVAGFELDKYMGVWYELAYHDWTQYAICGCTRFNMTRRASIVEDMFTTKCPKNRITGLGQTYAVNMSMTINPATPGRFQEKAFNTDWPNMVLDVWGSRAGINGKEQYNRAIQMQCVEVAGKRAFVGINFLSRTPIVPEFELEEMFERADRLGLPQYGGNRVEMQIVDHTACRYPRTTDRGVIYRQHKLGVGEDNGLEILDTLLQKGAGVKLIEKDLLSPLK